MSWLEGIGSIKVKLGALVIAAATVAAVVAAIGGLTGVPLVLTLPVTLLLALVVTQLLAAGMVAPLQEMTAAAQGMARGAHGVRVRTQNTDEVGRLAAAFNQMAADLEKVDVERRDLIATVSHELRTPVAAITAQLENLVDGVVEVDRDHLEQVLDSAERLGALVRDLLNLSRLEAGVVDLDLAPVDLRELVDQCLTDVRSTGRDPRVELSIPEGMQVLVDPARMRQLLINVLDNAARHAPAESVVRVHAGTEASGAWWLEVLDEGPGVAPEERERVFERFGTDAAGGGTGVGLAIARWVARLHEGQLAFLEPDAGSSGARLRLDLSALPSARAISASAPAPLTVDIGQQPYPVTSGVASPTAAPLVTEHPLVSRWPERSPEPDLRVVGASAAVGLLAGAVMAFSGPGVGWVLVLTAAGATAWWASARRRETFTLVTTALATALVLSVLVNSTSPMVAVAIFVAAGTFLSGVTGARTLRGMLASGFAWPLSSLRGMPWFARTLHLAGSTARGPAVVRTILVSSGLTLVFGLLFVSADAVLARWLDNLIPELRVDTAVARLFVAGGVFAMTLAAAYLGRNPVRVDPVEREVTPSANRWEWLAPVLVVDAIFAVFVASQVFVVLAGHEYLRETVGLSYAEYVHEGFGQLVVATALALVVVWAASRRAGASAADRRWLRISTGILGALTLGVVVSALARMAVYQDAYGFTQLRVLVNAFEGWLGFVVAAVMILGLLGRARWVPRVALVSGAAVVLALSLLNLDAFVAERNIDRFERTGRLDVEYLAQLGDGALPTVVDRLDPELARCVVELGPRGAGRTYDAESDEFGWESWSIGRARADEAMSQLGDVRPAGGGECVRALGGSGPETGSDSGG
ncbi:DUF4153 domain-containing protein [Nocardioides gilvus]|uniref:DUF4153 domain-containing protein n=1 Tax=Nocardioides gilvus TaxID=1735589 RepID=UPI000D744A44|nr:DUF4153 domain-containing protein [Nocardioides gilvus]